MVSLCRGTRGNKSHVTKELLSLIATALTIVAFFPYIRSVHAGKTKPHVFSWVIWGVTPLIVFLAQLADKGGAGAWPTGVSGVVTLCVALLAWLNHPDNTITRTDWMFLTGAMLSLPLWYLTSDPLWAVVVLTLVDVLGFGPTFRKAHRRPHEEQLTFFAIMIVRNALSIVALENYSVTTMLFPAVTGAVCIAFILLVARRRRIMLKLAG